MTEEQIAERYRLLGTLGSGAAADMFLAEDLKHGGCVAIKRFGGRHAGVQFALKEASIIQGIKHPHVVQCSDFFYQGNKGLYLVYEYMDGGSLRDWMRSKEGFSLEEAVDCVRQVLSGLSILHRLNVVHCDLKPENVLVQYIDRRPIYKIGDFDVAVFVKEIPEGGWSVEGSPAYMAPERFGDAFSFSSDLYSVGVLFFELLVGDRPFRGNTAQLMLAHRSQTPDVSAIENKIAAEVVERLLAKLPEERYESAEAVLNVLDSLVPPSGSEKERERIAVHEDDFEFSTERKLDFEVAAPATSGGLEELCEFALPFQPQWSYLWQHEDHPYLGIVHEYELEIYNGISGESQQVRKAWMNFEVQPSNPHSLVYRTQYSIACLDLNTMRERTLVRDLSDVTGFCFHPGTNELVWTDSRIGHYLHLDSGHTHRFPCMNFGIVPHLRFGVNRGLIYSTGPVSPSLNFMNSEGLLVDKILLDSPVINATEGIGKMCFITLSHEGNEAYKLYFYDENKGLEIAHLEEDIRGYSTFGHYLMVLLSDGSLRTYRSATEFEDIHFEGPKSQALLTSVDNRFIYLVRNEGGRQIFRGYRNHEGALS